MRELRFRVWDKENERYCTGVGISQVFTDMTNGELAIIFPNSVFSGQYIVEQYTGLKDKNGKEIYEGDIVDYNDDGECIGVVKYDAPEFYLDADATNWARMFLKDAPHQRVIGNINENADLLEEKK